MNAPAKRHAWAYRLSPDGALVGPRPARRKITGGDAFLDKLTTAGLVVRLYGRQASLDGAGPFPIDLVREFADLQDAYSGILRALDAPDCQLREATARDDAFWRQFWRRGEGNRIGEIDVEF